MFLSSTSGPPEKNDAAIRKKYLPLSQGFPELRRLPAHDVSICTALRHDACRYITGGGEPPVENEESGDHVIESEDQTTGKKKIDNMLDNTGDWCDCCSCEAEPQWQEAAEQPGIELSDRDEPG